MIILFIPMRSFVQTVQFRINNLSMLCVRKRTIAVAATITIYSYSMSVAALNLPSLVEDSAQYDADYQKALHEWQAAREQTPQARSALLPNVEVVAGKSRHLDVADADTVNNPGEYDSDYYGLSVRQALYRQKEVIAYKQAKQRVQQSKWQFQIAESQLILRTATAFFDVVLLENDLRVLSEQQDAAKQQLKSAQLRFDLGNSDINDTFAAQARLDSLDAQLADASAALAIAKENLAFIIGPEVLVQFGTSSRPQPMRFKSIDVNNIPLMAISYEDLLRLCETQNPTIQIQSLALNVADQEITQHKLIHSPSLDFVANYQDQSSNSHVPSNGLIPNETATIELQFRLPLYQGGSRISKHREAVYSRYAAQDALTSEKRKVQLAVSKAYQGIKTSTLQINAQKRAVTSNTNALRAAERGMELGNRSILDVLDAQDALFNAERNLNAARSRQILSILELYESVGQLTIASLTQFFYEITL